MRYEATYRVPDPDDLGCSERNAYIVINSVGYYEFDEPYGATHRKHGRKDFYLSYNHSGSMKLRFSNKDCQIGSGTVFIYKPFEEQYYGQAEKDPISNYWVHFTGYGINELLINAKLSEGSIFEIGVDDNIPDIFEKLISEISEKRHGFELLTGGLLVQLISLISRKRDMNNTDCLNRRDLRINESISYIHRNYEKRITISELADMVNLSTNRYSSVFKRITGLSPQQYLINFRLQKAREMINHTNLNIRQISSLIGFDDPLYFSRLFKKYEKVSPSDYLSKIKTDFQ